LLTASLRDGLASTVSEAIAKTPLAGTIQLGVGWHDRFSVCRQCQLHTTIKRIP
jgi:hypothetical protein